MKLLKKITFISFFIFTLMPLPAFSAIDVNQKGYICHTLDEKHSYKSDTFMAIYFEDKHYYFSQLFFKKNKKKKIKFNLLSKKKEKYYVTGKRNLYINLKHKKFGGTIWVIDILNSSITTPITNRKLSCKGYHLKDAFFQQLERIENAIFERKFKKYNNHTYDMKFEE